jgi:hypothetical protein
VLIALLAIANRFSFIVENRQRYPVSDNSFIERFQEGSTASQKQK